MSRRRVHPKGRGSALKVPPVFLAAVVILVVALFVYVELMLTFPW